MEAEERTQIYFKLIELNKIEVFGKLCKGYLNGR